MRNLLTLVGLAVVLFGGVGWYRGWYQFKTEATTPGHRQFHVDVNTDKITTDVKKGEQKVENVLSHGNGSTAPTASVPAVSGQPTSNPGNGLSVNDDGSVTFKGNFSFPPLPAPPNQQ